ncbi:MAG: tetratricopeptide repeat protein [Cyclobacteriaceae bacterium]|nr:tetratricopeptide repeat protein [Cyclobacteriaceae bacterium]MCH8516687.1 tetratricopeptide repeat protein [Cyclobacteriaceae bacterium]
MKHIIIIILLGLFFCLAPAEAQAQDISHQMQSRLEKAKQSMDAGDYGAANKQFRQMLSMEEDLPVNMSYLFAETLYMLRQFENAKNFLNRYLKIEGVRGDYYDRALRLQKELDKKIKEIEDCNLCSSKGYKMTSCSQCNGDGELEAPCKKCQGKGNIVCRDCMGDGVRLTVGRVGGIAYEDCKKCSQKGYHACNQCNGEKKIKQDCEKCLGSGLEDTKEICDHQQGILDIN